ncbi:MAG: hypothetical protein JSV41_00465 [Gemmatimonadota bacterium]|nr:MAG: hypothetical protein JSV41_00465 [Gemmatimonadota bacterium]
MRSLVPSRSTVNKILALAGIVIIFVQLVLIAETRLQVIVVLLGILLNQIGTWGLAGHVMPERRKYLQLRSEVDRFLGLVRRLNTDAVSGYDAGVDEAKAAMHQSVDRMASVAGVTETPEREG